ncbi:hypothetical protein AVEN_246910-1 [Araneus ventricosus]|uniref:Uncharacterized protein n=1 Tax=Araneus ventricosus TaxID=182803 RepID=A0A4Y2UEZ5_ARAVE|nr:hypothetical protein AVEN_246910-1 [Araneus ventricosus]
MKCLLESGHIDNCVPVTLSPDDAKIIKHVPAKEKRDGEDEDEDEDDTPTQKVMGKEADIHEICGAMFIYFST